MLPALRSIPSQPVSSRDTKTGLPAIGVVVVIVGLILNALWALLLAGLVVVLVL